MSNINKGDFVIVPRNYAVSIFGNYGRFDNYENASMIVPSKEMGEEENTLLFICDRTDRTITLAVPVFEFVSYDISVTDKETTDIEEFEKSRYVKCSEDVPYYKLKELIAVNTAAAESLQTLRHILCLLFILGISTYTVSASLMKMEYRTVLSILVAEWVVLFPALLLVSQKLTAKRAHRKWENIIKQFHALQKKYNFFYYMFPERRTCEK